MNAFSTRKKRIAALVAAAAILAVGGSAYAYWTSSGNGTGTATTGTSSSFTVTSEDPTGGPLTPGGPTESVGFTVTNSGSGSQKLSSVIVSVANSNGTAWAPTGAAAGCSAADYAIGTPVIVYGQIASLANTAGTVTVTMNNLDTNQDACKNVPVPLYIAAS